MFTYDEPLIVPVVALGNAAVSTTADIAQVASPMPGMKGRVLGVSAVTKVATTVAASALRIGIPSDTDLYGSLPVPITAVDTRVGFTKAQIAAISELPADTVITIDGDGAATAGSLDLVISIGWYF